MHSSQHLLVFGSAGSFHKDVVNVFNIKVHYCYF